MKLKGASKPQDRVSLSRTISVYGKDAMVLVKNRSPLQAGQQLQITKARCKRRCSSMSSMSSMIYMSSLGDFSGQFPRIFQQVER